MSDPITPAAVIVALASVVSTMGAFIAKNLLDQIRDWKALAVANGKTADEGLVLIHQLVAAVGGLSDKVDRLDRDERGRRRGRENE